MSAPVPYLTPQERRRARQAERHVADVAASAIVRQLSDPAEVARLLDDPPEPTR